MQQAAADLTFLLSSPGSCLFQTTDTVDNLSSDLAALWLRAVFHDAGTWAANNDTGGADGSLVNELNVEENLGIGNSIASRFISHNTTAPTSSTLNVSSADLIALGGIVTVKYCGGPQIPFRPGRVDVASGVQNDYSILPNPFYTIDELKALFVDRMGMTAVDMLVLTTGSHSMGGAHASITPKVTNESFAPFDSTPGVFDNDIWKRVLNNTCVLPIDCLFASDSELLPYIQLYADNETAFFEQYSISLQKMMELSNSSLGDVVDLSIGVHTSLVAEGTYPKTSTSSSASSTASASVSTSRTSGAGDNGLPASRIYLLAPLASFGFASLFGALVLLL
ncbi:hypothetical protein HK405_012025 [Cladochytrium tenue]|nr:hypothetical protein HK405_012025 [Cladochytrium tenue]